MLTKALESIDYEKLQTDKFHHVWDVLDDELQLCRERIATYGRAVRLVARDEIEEAHIARSVLYEKQRHWRAYGAECGIFALVATALRIADPDGVLLRGVGVHDTAPTVVASELHTLLTTARLLGANEINELVRSVKDDIACIERKSDGFRDADNADVMRVVVGTVVQATMRVAPRRVMYSRERETLDALIYTLMDKKPAANDGEISADLKVAPNGTRSALTQSTIVPAATDSSD